MAADYALPLAPASSSSAAVSMHRAAGYCAGFSCALAALGAQGRVAGGCDLGASRRGCRWSRARELALLEKLAALERQVEELRHRRAEDARANEKVAGIFASHEQRWFTERKSLRRQVDAVVAAARAREAQREEEAGELRRQLEEQRDAAELKDRAMEQEIQRREGAEERLRAAERAAEELRERAGKEAAEHAAEVRKHKAVFVELASAQRQLEADLARAARLADTAEAELREALERRDEAASAAADLSAEAARLRRDADHKDKILSAMLRKSKIDMEDREMLVREVKLCKARRKQAELEAERWRKMWESRGHRRGSSRSSSARGAAEPPPPPSGCSDKVLAPDAAARAANLDTKILFVDHVEGDGKKDHRQAPAKELTTIECVDSYASHVDDKPGMPNCSVLYSALFCSLMNCTRSLLIWSAHAAGQDSIEKSFFLLCSKHDLSSENSMTVFQTCRVVNNRKCFIRHTPTDTLVNKQAVFQSSDYAFLDLYGLQPWRSTRASRSGSRWRRRSTRP
jgi:hypothetical protein